MEVLKSRKLIQKLNQIQFIPNNINLDFLFDFHIFAYTIIKSWQG